MKNNKKMQQVCDHTKIKRKYEKIDATGIARDCSENTKQKREIFLCREWAIGFRQALELLWNSQHGSYA